MDEKDNKDAINHLEKLREDIRDEIKKRIGQRDSYSTQLTIALSAVIGIAFTHPDRSGILIILPLISIYFTVLIMYSYEIHHFAARYLRDEIEIRLAYLCGTPHNIEWETYYKESKVPGIRRLFFLIIMVIITAISLVYIGLADNVKLYCKNVTFIIASSIYGLSIIWIFIWQRHAVIENIKNIKGFFNKKGRNQR